VAHNDSVAVAERHNYYKTFVPKAGDKDVDSQDLCSERFYWCGTQPLKRKGLVDCINTEGGMMDEEFYY